MFQTLKEINTPPRWGVQVNIPRKSWFLARGNGQYPVDI